MRRSFIDALPPETRAWLDAELVRRGFADYDELAEQLVEQGWQASKSSVHRYGQRFSERMDALRMATQQARAVVEAVPDDEGAISEALMRLVQEKLFAALLEMEVDPKSIKLGPVAKAIAELARATVTQKKWAAELRDKVRAAAESVERTARGNGLSGDAVDLIRREILGIAGPA